MSTKKSASTADLATDLEESIMQLGHLARAIYLAAEGLQDATDRHALQMLARIGVELARAANDAFQEMYKLYHPEAQS